MRLMIKLIIKYIDGLKPKPPEYEIRCSNEENTDIIIRFPELKKTVTILKIYKWKEAKRILDKKMNSDDKNECEICYTQMIENKVSCPKCANYYCGECYINIYRENKGIIICPFCRWKYGYKPSNIEEGINDIRYMLKHGV